MKRIGASRILARSSSPGDVLLLVADAAVTVAVCAPGAFPGDRIPEDRRGLTSSPLRGRRLQALGKESDNLHRGDCFLVSLAPVGEGYIGY